MFVNTGAIAPGYRADSLLVWPESSTAEVTTDQQISALLRTRDPQETEGVFIPARPSAEAKGDAEGLNCARQEPMRQNETLMYSSTRRRAGPQEQKNDTGVSSSADRMFQMRRSAACTHNTAIETPDVSPPPPHAAGGTKQGKAITQTHTSSRHDVRAGWNSFDK